MPLFQRPFHCSFLQWTHNHHMVKNHGKVVHCPYEIIWIHVTLWIWCIKTRFIAHEWVNELKVHFTKMFGKTLHGFVFSKHFLIFFVMAHIVHIVIDILVLSTQRPPICLCKLVHCGDAQNYHWYWQVLWCISILLLMFPCSKNQ